MMTIKNTIVFQKNWEAINAVDENGKRKYRYIINEGSSRSSKTYSLIDCYDLYCRQHKDKRLTAWRDTKTDARKTILNDTLKRLKSTGRYKLDQGFNKTESIFQYNTDSTFEIHGTDDEETVHGLTQDASWLNEPYKISKDTFDQIDQRTSDFVFIDWNPKKDHWIDDLKKDPRTIVIHSTFKDNPFCPIEQKIKILGYQPVKRSYAVENDLINEFDAKDYDFDKNPLNLEQKYLKELLRCVLNEEKRSANISKWDIYGLGIKAERPNRIFKWESIPYSEYLKIDKKPLNGVDWGKVDPFGIVEAKYYDGTLYVHELNYDSEDKWQEKLTPLQRQNIDTKDEGFIKWLFKNLNIPASNDIICDNNRPGKVIALRKAGWERAIAANKGSGSVLDGIDVLLSIKVVFTDCSDNIAYEQENYSRKVDKYGVVLEEPEDIDNHLIDPIRYIALYLQKLGVIKKL